MSFARVKFHISHLLLVSSFPSEHAQRMPTHAHDKQNQKHAHTYTHARTCTYIHARARTRKDARAHPPTHTHTPTHAHTHMHMFTLADAFSRQPKHSAETHAQRMHAFSRGPGMQGSVCSAAPHTDLHMVYHAQHMCPGAP